MNETHKKRRRLAIWLGALQVFIGVGGVAGGVGLVTEPSGANLGMPVEALSDSPFSDYLIPGIVLLATNGVGNLVGGILTFIRHRRAGEIAIALGAFLMMWILTQVWWIGLIHWLQHLYFIFGVVELVLGVRLRRSLESQPCPQASSMISP